MEEGILAESETPGEVVLGGCSTPWLSASTRVSVTWSRVKNPPLVAGSRLWSSNCPTTFNGCSGAGVLFAPPPEHPDITNTAATDAAAAFITDKYIFCSFCIDKTRCPDQPF